MNFYTDKYWLMQGDCLELMKNIPDKSVDMVLCDLPYGVTSCEWDKVLPFEDLWVHYHRIVKDTGAIVLHCQQPFTSRLIMSNEKQFKYCWIWDKHYARGFLNAKKQPLRNHEEIVVFYAKQCTYNPRMTKGKMRQKGNSNRNRGCYGDYNVTSSINDIYYPTTILDFAGCPNSKSVHPTQKPVALLEYLIETYTNPGEVVLDNCMGSGSTGVACMNVGRKFIGIELDDGYFEIAKKRIEENS